MPFIIGIEGSVASGKSTLLDDIESETILVIREPWDVGGNLLAKYYMDPQKYAYEFQLRILCRRAHTHYTVQRATRSNTIVMERTLGADYFVFSRLTYGLGYLSDEDYANYCDIYNDLAFFVNAPNIYIYLRANVDLLMERIKSRNRKGEENITVDYLMQLQELHDRWLLNNNNNINVHLIEINEHTTQLDVRKQFHNLLGKYDSYINTIIKEDSHSIVPI